MAIIYNGTNAANKLAAISVFPYSEPIEMYGYGGDDVLKGAFLHSNLIYGGLGNDTLSGGADTNRLYGEDGNDLIGAGGADNLYGDANNDLLVGGAGNDVLYGGSGQDTFRFDTALSTSKIQNLDQIKDLIATDNTIQLENTIFTALGSTQTGVINSAHFKANATGLATDSNDYIIYETDTGKLFYDANGSAAGGSQQIALLGTHLTLTNADFVLV